MQDYQARKAHYRNMITIYGRKPVLEVLQDPSIRIAKLHMADSNKPGGIVQEIMDLAEQRGIEIAWHNKQALSRISRNGKQDQGVAADIASAGYRHFSEFTQANPGQRIIALDGVTNPQNLGMIIRSVCAGGVDGLLLPEKGCSDINPLVIKASVGTVFKTPILRCTSLPEALPHFRELGWSICVMSSHAKTSIHDRQNDQPCIYILGNESDGVGKTVNQLADRRLRIPMQNDVESLNVAITAALLAFMT